jgi:hypothetical protein
MASVSVTRPIHPPGEPPASFLPGVATAAETDATGHPPRVAWSLPLVRDDAGGDRDRDASSRDRDGPLSSPSRPHGLTGSEMVTCIAHFRSSEVE